jgi:hypothetical protein
VIKNREELQQKVKEKEKLWNQNPRERFKIASPRVCS